MSAFIVSDKHLQTLINWANQNQVYFYYNGKHYKSDDVPTLDLLLTVLHRQNVRSVDRRYQEKNVVDSLRVKLTPVTLSPVEILKACDCYDYQACETEDYHQTFAYDIIRRIRETAITKLPGYSGAKWSID